MHAGGKSFNYPSGTSMRHSGNWQRTEETRARRAKYVCFSATDHRCKAVKDIPNSFTDYYVVQGVTEVRERLLKAVSQKPLRL
jgi:hypothetical protein